MRKLLIIAAAALMAIVSAAVALATPGSGILSAPVLARAAFGGNVTLQSTANQATGLTWRGREWKAEQLPEFLQALRDQGKVADLGRRVAVTRPLRPHSGCRRRARCPLPISPFSR